MLLLWHLSHCILLVYMFVSQVVWGLEFEFSFHKYLTIKKKKKNL